MLASTSKFHIIYNNIFADTNDTVDLFCNDGDVRLVDGVNELGGRVEMCYNKFWGSVCHQKWQTGDADIVCKQLHFQPTGIYQKYTFNISSKISIF